MKPLTLHSITANSPSTAPAPYRFPPYFLFVADIWLSATRIFNLFNILYPLYTENPRAELYLFSFGNVSSIILGLALIVVGLFSLSLVPLWFVLPGSMWLLYGGAFFFVTKVLSLVLNGKRQLVVSSGRYLQGNAGIAREKWFFVNGVMVGKYWSESAVEEIERRFGRRVTGIHNRRFSHNPPDYL